MVVGCLWVGLGRRFWILVVWLGVGGDDEPGPTVGLLGGAQRPPGLCVAVVACMDARVNVDGILGLSEGDAHVIRNAGGVISEDTIRSLAISQRLLGTTEIILIHHADCCGMRTFSDELFKTQIETDSDASSEYAAAVKALDHFQGTVDHNAIIFLAPLGKGVPPAGDVATLRSVLR
ncbi:MAG: carbonic anhydrase [Allobranchiibius sp.]